MSQIRNGITIYHVLERLLKKARDRNEPITSVEAFDDNAIKAHAETVNKVPDHLGHLYRRGYIERYPAPKTPNSQAKFSYQWKKEKAPPARVQHDQAVARSVAMGGTSGSANVRRPDRQILLSRPTIEISQDGNLVNIELPGLQIIIRSTRQALSDGA